VQVHAAARHAAQLPAGGGSSSSSDRTVNPSPPNEHEHAKGGAACPTHEYRTHLDARAWFASE
jgi:hypothetical protein